MTKLSDLTIDEVSLVRKGANQHARVAIAKSADDPGGTVELFDDQGNPLDSESLEHGDVVYDGNGVAYQYDESGDEPHEGEYDEDELEDDEVEKGFGAGWKGLAGPASGRLDAAATRLGRGAKKRTPLGARLGAAQATSAVRGAGQRATTGVKNSHIGQGAAAATTYAAQRGGTMAGGIVGRGQRAASAVQGFAQNGANRQAALQIGGGGVLGGAAGYGASRKRNSVNKSFSEELQVELSKALTEDDRDAIISKAFGAIDELSAQADYAMQVAEEEREARRDAEFYEVAKSYSALPIETEVLAEVFKACADNLDPEHVEVIAKCFNFATNALFEEQGSIGGGANSDIMAQVEAAAQGNVRKSHGDPSQFVVDAFGSDPGLYDQYLAETGR